MSVVLRDSTLVAVTQATSADGSACVKIGVEQGHLVNGHIDTGAAPTCLSLAALHTMQLQHLLRPYKGPKVEGVGQSTVPVAGLVSLHLRITPDVEVVQEALVMDRLCYPLLLGRDFLTKFGPTKIDWSHPDGADVWLGEHRLQGARQQGGVTQRVALAAKAADQQEALYYESQARRAAEAESELFPEECIEAEEKKSTPSAHEAKQARKAAR